MVTLGLLKKSQLFGTKCLSMRMTHALSGCYKPHVSGHAELPCPLRTILVYLTPLGEVCHAVKQLNVLLSSANLGRVWE